MFGPLPFITFIRWLLKPPNNLLRVLHTDIYDGIYCLFCISLDLFLDLRPRELINPFPDIPKLCFGSEDVITILSRLRNFNELSKVTYFSLPLIFMCFLTFQRPHFFMFTSENSLSVKFYSPLNLYSQNVFRVEQL